MKYDIEKSEIVRAAIQEQDWKKALQIAKDFRIGVTQEQRDKMARAYECIVHPDFYRQIEVDIPEAIEQGKEVVKEYAANRRKNSMKWDVKHDRAKRVIDIFLECAINWHGKGEFTVPKIEDLDGNLTKEERMLVNEEMEMMIASIRKRYKLQERLPEQKPQIEPEKTEVVIPTKKAEETLPEPVNEEKGEEKPKKTRRASTGEKKVSARKPRAKEEVKEA